MHEIINFLLTLDLNGMLIPTLSILEKIIRPLIIYFALILILRIAGKREFAQLNTFDFVVLLMISNIIQNSIIGNDNSITGGIIGAITLVIINFIMAKFVYTHQKLEKIIDGETDILIDNGIINEKILAKELITKEELELAAHKQGIANLNDIEKSELGQDGKIFFIAKTPSEDILRHNELLGKIEILTNELKGVKDELLKMSK